MIILTKTHIEILRKYAWEQNPLRLSNKPRIVDPIMRAALRTPKCKRCRVPHERLVNKLCSHCIDELAFVN